MTEVRIDISYNAGDGYWRVSSPDVPGLHLAARTRRDAIRDLGPILDDLIDHNYRNKPAVADYRLIVALDVESIALAEAVVRELGDTVSFYKIGPHLFEEGLFKFIRDLKYVGKNVFLDFKTTDIGSTVARMIAHADDLRVDFISVMGGYATVEAAVKHRTGLYPKILAVTLLTDQDAFDMQREYLTDLRVSEFVYRRAIAAAKAGADGVICSPKEIIQVREAIKTINPKMLIVTPGIRPTTLDLIPDSHKRTGTPHAAIQSGASHIVVGRPIVLAANRLEAARKIIAEINANKTT